MHFIQGASARDYNRRKEREGSFWCGRFRPTLIQGGSHFSRCLFYITLNMVRAGVVGHPSQWKTCGYHELAGLSKRNMVVNKDRLLSCIGHAGDYDGFVKWYLKTIDEKLKAADLSREPIWTEAAAVGELDWVESLAKRYGAGKSHVVTMRSEFHNGANTAREARASYRIKVSGPRRADLALGNV